MSWKFQVSISISKLGKGRENRWWFKNQWFDTIVGLPGKMISRRTRNGSAEFYPSSQEVLHGCSAIMIWQNQGFLQISWAKSL